MAKLFANSGDPDQTLHSAASDLGLHWLPFTLLQVSRLQWVKGNHLLPLFWKWYQGNIFKFFVLDAHKNIFLLVTSLSDQMPSDLDLHYLLRPVCQSGAGLSGLVGCALTGDQKVASSIPARSATFFHGDWSWNIFYGRSLHSADSRRAVVSFWQKNVHNTG